MKRSTKISLSLVPVVASAALALSCRNDDDDWDERRACVDAANQVVSATRCQSNAAFYHWYIYRYAGGPDPYIYRPGHVIVVPRTPVFVGGGHITPLSAHPSTISRGGFGSSAHGVGA